MSSKNGGNITGTYHTQTGEKGVKAGKDNPLTKEEIRKRNGDASKIGNPR
jgi:hypothetical protein